MSSTCHGAQVFGFSVRQADQYAHYDWDQLTTVAWNTDPALMCMVRTARCHPILGCTLDQHGDAQPDQGQHPGTACDSSR